MSPYDTIRHIPPPDHTIVAEWCDRYRLVVGDGASDGLIFRLAAKLYAQGLIPQTSNAMVDWRGRRLSTQSAA